MTQAFNLAQLANNLNTSGQLDATDGLSGVLPIANGGTGSSTAAFSGANITNLNASNLASGTVPVARQFAGTVVQTVSYTKTAKQLLSPTTNTMSEVDTNFRVTITPRASTTKMLCSLYITGGSQTGCPRFRMEYSTNGGSTWNFVTPVGDADGSRTQSHCSLNINGDGNVMQYCGAQVLFTHGTTNTIIFRMTAGGDQPNMMMWNGSRNNSDNFLGNTMVSSYTVQEIVV